MKRKMLSIFLTLAMVLSLLPAAALTARAADGEVIEISTREQLDAVRNDLSANYKLVADIDLGDKPWEPIGETDNAPFKGTFDGDGHKITGLHIDSSRENVGLFGDVKDGGVVKNVGVSGSVKSGGNVGGVVGYNNEYGTVMNCYYTGTVSDGNYVGGVVGLNLGSVENCYNTGKVSGGSSTVGGVVGWTLNPTGKVTNCYNTGTVSGDRNVGGVVGDVSFGGTMTNCYYLDTCVASSSTGTSRTAEQFKSLANTLGSDWEDHPILGRPVLKVNREAGAGSADDPYTISNLMELENFRDYVNKGSSGNGLTFKLTDDIEMSEKYGNGKESWESIGAKEHPFTGTFNGGGCEIKGLYIDSYDGYVGLFGYVGSGGTVENVGVVDDDVSSSCTAEYAYVGGVVGNNSGTVKNCYNTGEVNNEKTTGSYRRVGGVVGENSGTVEICYNTGTVSGKGDIGGVVGCNIGAVENCYNTGAVSSYDGNCIVGGVVGYNFDGKTLENCYSTGVVSIDDDNNVFGGVVGSNIFDEVKNCYYLADSEPAIGGIHGADITGRAERRTTTQFASGEVAWLLQNANGSTQIWGQTVGRGTPELTGDKSKVVHQVTFTYDDDGTDAEYRYANHGGTVSSIPTAPSGYEWQFDGAPFTSSVKVNENIEVTLREKTNTGGNTGGNIDGGNTGGDADDDVKVGGTTVTVPPGGTVTPNADGTVTVPDGSTVKPENGPEMVLPNGGVVAEDGSVTVPKGGSVEVGGTTVTFPEGATLTPDKDGKIDIPAGSLITKADGTTETVPKGGGKLDGRGNYTPNSNGSSGTPSTPNRPSGGGSSGGSSSGGTSRPTSTSKPDNDNTDPPAPPTPPTPPAPLLSDLDPGAWYQESVDYVVRSGLMTGYGDGRFGPDDTLSRAMLAQILYTHAGGVPVNYLMQYDDVPADTWYTEAIRWAASEGIVSGYGDGKIGPSDPITREQLAVMLYRYGQSRDDGITGVWTPQTGYTDSEEISDWAYDAMNWCVSNGIIVGKDGVLDPKGEATRAEAAAMLMRFLTRSEE